MRDEVLRDYSAIVEYLENLSDDELKYVHNQYCQHNSYSDDEIYDNDDDFFDTFFADRPADAVRSAFFGDYRHGDYYVKFNGYGNLVSANRLSEFIDIGDIANDILENESEYDNIELTEA